MEYENNNTALFQISANKPQLHSRKCHHTYNATRCLPSAVWIRSLRFGLDLDNSRPHSRHGSDYGSDDDEDDRAILGDNDCAFFSSSCTVLYEIVLYYDHNRACTIYRTPEDFAKLKEAVGPAKYRKWVPQQKTHGLAPSSAVEDVEDLQRLLSKTISRKGRDCPALEYFLRRRMNDCGGQ